MTQAEWLKIGSKWKTTTSKTVILIPALEDILGYVNGKRILDIGCGDGFIINFFKSKGADCTGVDISADTIRNCKKIYPNGNFFVQDVKKLSLGDKFDFILALYLFLSFNDKQEIVLSLNKMGGHLKKNGKIIIATAHPAFDFARNAQTMEKFFDEEYIYSKKGLPVHYKHKSRNIEFVDFHWMVEDYAQCIKEAGFLIEDIREPMPIENSKTEDPEIYDARIRYPPIIIFVCRK